MAVGKDEFSTFAGGSITYPNTRFAFEILKEWAVI
jgi:hypothetical protein